MTVVAEPEEKLTGKAAVKKRRELFVASYVRNRNATRAAKDAGFSEATAYSQGHRLLKNAEIQRMVQEASEERFAAVKMGPDETLAEIAKVARFNIARFTTVGKFGDPLIDMSDMTEDDFAALSEIEVHDYLEGKGDDAREVKKVKVKTHSKLGALQTLAKIHGLVTDKVEVTGSDSLLEALQAAQKRAEGE